MVSLTAVLLLATAQVSQAPAPPPPAANLAELITVGSGAKVRTLRDLDSTWSEVQFEIAIPYDQPGARTSAMVRPKQIHYFTRGETLVIGGKRLLVAFRPAPPEPDFGALVKPGARPGALSAGRVADLLTPRLTPETPLALCLLDTAQTHALSATRPFNLQEATTERLALSEAGPKALIEAAVLLPVFAQARAATGKAPPQTAGRAVTSARLRRRAVISLTNLKRLAWAAFKYCGDHHDRLPPMRDLAAMHRALKPYLGSRADSVFRTPEGEPYHANAALSGKLIDAIPHAERTVLFYEARPDASGTRNTVLLDGHARVVRETDWPRVRRQSGITY